MAGVPTPDDPLIDPTIANPARIYDYLLGGAHNFEADREAAGRMLPTAALTARTNRSFLRRAVRYLVDRGVDQFLDLGSGIPTVGNVHEIAQRADPEARVVYVDNEPVAVTHGRLLLAAEPYVTMIDADLRDAGTVLAHPDLTRLLDFHRPVGLLFAAVFHFVPDEADPAGIVARYLRRLQGGGYVALSHYTADAYSDTQREAATRAGDTYRQGTGTPVVTRSKAQLAALLAGTDLVEPGITWAQDWRPDSFGDDTAGGHDIYGAVARVRP